MLGLAPIAVALVCVLLALAAAAYAYLRHTFTFWQRLKVPGPAPTMPFGNFKDTIMAKATLSAVLDDIYREYRDERFVGTYFLSTPLLQLHDPEIIRHVFIKEFQDFNGRGTHTATEQDPLSGHLFNLSGAPWRNLRVKLSPTFTTGKIKYMFQTIHECAVGLEKHVVSSMEAKGGAYVEDVRELLACFFTDIISSVAFGIQSNSMNNSKSEFRRMGQRVFDPSLNASGRVLLSFFFRDVMRIFGLRAVPGDVHHFFTRLVKETIDYREKNHVDRADMLNLLIQLKNEGFVPPDATEENGVSNAEREAQRQKLTERQIAAQVFVFFLAGFETTSSTSSFVLFELAKNPDVLERVLQEVDEVLEKHGGKVTYDTISDMTYTDMVIFETMRLYPAVPFLSREVMVRRALPLTDLELDKGVRLFIPVTALHMDPQYWEEPDVFDPLRFTEEAKKARHPMVYLPFGDGPRICIGMRLALVQVKMALITILSKCKVSLAPGTPRRLPLCPRNIVPSPEDGVKLILTARSS